MQTHQCGAAEAIALAPNPQTNTLRIFIEIPRRRAISKQQVRNTRQRVPLLDFSEFVLVDVRQTPPWTEKNLQRMLSVPAEGQGFTPGPVFRLIGRSSPAGRIGPR